MYNSAALLGGAHRDERLGGLHDGAGSLLRVGAGHRGGWVGGLGGLGLEAH